MKYLIALFTLIIVILAAFNIYLLRKPKEVVYFDENMPHAVNIADVDNNGYVDMTDFRIVESSYLNNNLEGDINKDGKTDLTDLSILAQAIHI